MLTIIPVVNARQRRMFVNLPWSLYRGNPHWIPPLKSDMHQTLNPKHNALLNLGPYCFFLALKDGIPVGRIGCGLDRRLNTAKGIEMGYLTLFETIQDYQVAKELFDAAVGFLRRHGATLVTGPQSPSNGDDYRGLLIDGFDGPPVLLNTYNPPWYRDFFEEYGFTKQFDRNGYWSDLTGPLPEKIIRGVALAEKRYKFSLRPINMKNLDQEMVAIKRISDLSMPEEWPDMIPPSMEEIRAEVNKLKALAVPDLMLIAESEEGEPIGIAITLPDYNQVLKHLNGRLFPIGWLKFLLLRKKITQVRCFVIMVIPSYHRKGVSAALYLRSMEAARRLGYTSGDGSSIHEFNIRMNRDALGSGGTLYRVWRVFQLSI